VALTGAGLGMPSIARALSSGQSLRQLPLQSRQPTATFFPDLVDPETLRTLARAGIEAAQRAGATYADIRVSDSRWLRMFQSGIFLPISEIDFKYTYGIRVNVGGAWSTAFGSNPTVDGVASSARSAVNMAKGLAKVVPAPLPFTAVPAQHGEWTTPIGIDPFAISPDEHVKLLGAYKNTAERVPDGLIDMDEFLWTSETRVVATSEGSVVTQRLARAFPTIVVAAWLPAQSERMLLPVQGFVPKSAGVEAMLGPALQGEIKVTTEEARQLGTVREGKPTVGRYEAVLDGPAMGALFEATLAHALGLDRVLGADADGDGTSFLGPVDDVLGVPFFSSALTITADRSMPHHGAARWDDEAVPVSSYPVVRDGRVVDYFATRANAEALSSWYAKSKKPMTLHGSAISWTPASAPVGAPMRLQVSPGAEGNSLDALVSRMTNGVLIRGVNNSYGGMDVDQQLSTGTFVPLHLYEVKRGKIVSRWRGGAVQFQTKQLLQSITTMGNAASMFEYFRQYQRWDPWRPITIASPAAHFKQIDVVQLWG